MFQGFFLERRRNLVEFLASEVICGKPLQQINQWPRKISSVLSMYLKKVLIICWWSRNKFKTCWLLYVEKKSAWSHENGQIQEGRKELLQSKEHLR